MQTYLTTAYTRSREKVRRRRWVCKPCTATRARINHLRKQQRWDELEQAVEAGKHSRAARIRANSGQVFSQAQAT